MLQEYPTQIQPRSSSTRQSQDIVQFPDCNNKLQNKVDAEASRILIDLANQDTSKTIHMLAGSTVTEHKQKRRSSSIKGACLPIKTDVNLHLQQERSQPDPIMLLAAAAAVIDDEGKYKGRYYERREIRLYGRHGSSKRKSFTYGSNRDQSTSSDSSNNTNQMLLRRRHSERRHRSSVTMTKDSWLQRSRRLEEEEDEEEEVEVLKVKGNEPPKPQSEGTHAFSSQYLSMKQNPRIKRNAMHAYITYMIYTDMAHEQQRRPADKGYNQQRYIKKEAETSDYAGTMNSDWYSSQPMQSYRLPPSPRQRHDPAPPPTETIIGRPLTDFLFERTNGLLPPPSTKFDNTRMYYE